MSKEAQSWLTMNTCKDCGREYATMSALRQHRAVKHPEEKSIAQRAIDAQLDRAMGLPTEDEFDWL